MLEGTRPTITRSSRPQGHGFGRPIEAHAALEVTAPSGGRSTTDRLERLMSGEEPPRRDVPRGYYLNIVV